MATHASRTTGNFWALRPTDSDSVATVEVWKGT